MALAVTHPRSPQGRFQNEWLRSLLSPIPKIWKQPTWNATTRSTSGAPLAIMVMVHGDFTGRIATRNGKLSKVKSQLFFSQYRHQCSNLLFLPNDYQWGFHGRRIKGWGWWLMQLFHFPELFWVTQMNPKERLLSPNAIFLLFYDVDVALDLALALDIAWEGYILEME